MNTLVVLYIDLIFIINFTINCLILIITGKILNVQPSKKRVSIAGTLGAAYAVLASFPEFNLLLTIIAKVFLSIVMVLISIEYKNIIYYLRFWIGMHLVAFAFGGAILSLSYFSNDINEIKPVFLLELPSIDVTILTIAILMTILIGAYLIYSFKKSVYQKDFLIPLTIGMDGIEADLTGLVDTGNHLVDPLTGNPVIIVEYQAISKLMPNSMTAKLVNEKELELNEMINVLGVDEWGKRLRVIPFSSVGKDYGLMLGFKPDKVVLINNGKKINNKDVIIGLCQRTLCPDNSYNALVNPRSVQ